MHWFISVKSGFYLPAFEISRSCRTASAKSSFYLPAFENTRSCRIASENGGLGIFEINDSQKVVWTVRAHNLDEIWKVQMDAGNLTNIKCSMLDSNRNPVLYSIAQAYERFLSGFTYQPIITRFLGKSYFWKQGSFPAAASKNSSNKRIFWSKLLQCKQKTDHLLKNI